MIADGDWAEQPFPVGDKLQEGPSIQIGGPLRLRSPFPPTLCRRAFGIRSAAVIRGCAAREQQEARGGAPSHGLASAYLLVEFLRGFRWLEPGLAAEVPLALVVLMHGQVRLVEARVAAHKQAV